MARLLRYTWGRVGQATRLNLALLVLSCLLSVQLVALAANFPLQTPNAAALAVTSTRDNTAHDINQGGAVLAALAEFGQADDLPRPMLHIVVSPSLVAWRLTQGQPCHDATMFVANITAWTVPPGCYGRIYRPDPGKYHAAVAFGTCTWWVEALHHPDILSSGQFRLSSVPKPGAIAVLAAGVQGAGKTGHYAEVIAVAPDHYWMLVSEMNFHWRGAGFGMVDFRYIHVGDGVSFLW